MGRPRDFTATKQRCSMCKKWLPYSDFWKSCSRLSGLNSRCIACDVSRLPYHRENHKKRHLKDPRPEMISGARHRAKRDGIPFSLTVSDVYIPLFCPVLGTPIKWSAGRGNSNSPTLDRIIPALGYVIGNVVVVSHRANRLKNDATLEELKKLTR